MVPRTTASACRSLAWRRPSRPCTASRTAVLISWVSVGSGVWLSKGRTATVLMLGGRPPPAKPYRQPPRARALRLARNPDVRRKVGLLGREEGEIEPSRNTRHREPGRDRSTSRVQGRLRPAYDLAGPAHQRHHPCGAPRRPGVLDGVGTFD